MLTPVRVRGKRGNRQLVKEWKTAAANAAKASVSSSINDMNSSPVLERLPNELLQKVLWESLNLNLAWTSLDLARRLNSITIRQEFVFLAFFGFCFDTRRLIDKHNGDSDQEGHKKGEIRHDITDYADARIAFLDKQSQSFIRKTILEQPWFTTKFFFSCQQQYVMDRVPAPLADLLDRKYQQSAPQPHTVFWNNILGQTPKWFRRILSLPSINEQDTNNEHEQDANNEHESDSDGNANRWSELNDQLAKLKDQDHGLRHKVRYYDKKRLRVCLWTYSPPASSDHMRKLIWDIRKLNKPANYFVIRTMPCQFPDLEIPLRFYDPKVWTMDHLALLQILSRRQAPGRMLADAARTALMSAISQTFFPAVYYYSSTPLSHRELHDGTERTSESWRALVHQVRNDAKTREEHKTGSINTKFMTQPGMQNTFGEDDIDKVDDDIMEVNSIGPEHIIKAMQIMCEPGATADNYDIFRYISIAYAYKKKNNKEQFPKKEFEEVYGLSVQAGTDLARKCYLYFNDLLMETWYSSSTRIRDYGSWFSSLEERDAPLHGI